VPRQVADVVAPSSQNRGVQGFLEELGPGLITGAADDDPSDVSTYSIAGLRSDTPRSGRLYYLFR
jgi:hypothetical protein